MTVFVPYPEEEQRVCRFCGITIAPEAHGWVSVEEGGPYDYCVDSPASHFDDKHHSPS